MRIAFRNSLAYSPALAAVTGQAIPHILAVLGNSFDGRSLLDVCCGPGHLSAAAAARGHRAEGIDFAPTMVALARRDYPPSGALQLAHALNSYMAERRDHNPHCSR